MTKFIDLFCGIGGFRLALEKSGLSCVFSSEIDKYAREAYHKNFGELPKGDITQISSDEIPLHDVLCAGFPCQPFSISGKKNGVRDDIGKLFFKIERIVSYHRPKIVLLENVKGILTIDNGNVVKHIDETLSKMGYVVHRYLLNSSYFGIPQKRERVYFVAIRKDLELRINLRENLEGSMNHVFLKRYH